MTANITQIYSWVGYSLHFPKNGRVHRLKSASMTASAIEANAIGDTGLDIGLWQPLARGASESENPLAPQKTHWPPKNM